VNYDDFTRRWLANEDYESGCKWKASCMAALFLGNGGKCKEGIAVADIGGGDGRVLNTFCTILNTSDMTVFDVSKVACDFGMSSHPKITFYNHSYWPLAAGRAFDIIILCDIIEHVDDDEWLIMCASADAKQVILKIPIEHCLWRVYRWIRGMRAEQRFGSTHESGHLRGYTIWEARRLVRKHLRIKGEMITEAVAFYGSERSKRIAQLIGTWMSVLLFGGSLYLLAEGRSKP